MRSITASHCRWHRGNRWGGARRHHESLSCVQLEPVASVSFLESVSIITRGQFEDRWVVFMSRVKDYFSRGCSALRDAVTRTSTVRRWRCAQEHTGLFLRVGFCGRQKGEKCVFVPSDSVICQRWAHAILFTLYFFFFRFVVYLLPSGRCFLSNFLFF